ncbi:molybdopterin converting factor subunit 1 [Gracilibacillus thailandensis]|uniref:Molybdopterin synthase sulfur carrier subunit n=1 Tax=Gracilibacillus thailandensis TaxID=563735 RepID=A0A6N7R472_9BACI|nr:molybdopterin converting factor subunit 1 [Gracilibacillus thailandensis]MRI68033.1 molybdopterin converting factor subunit 1 [Gracilibacillus thailandensis]
MIEVFLFAQLQEEVGKDKVLLDIKEITVKEIKHQLQSQFDLSQIEASMVAVNEAYALEDDIIRSGDTVAIIPPVSGG